jgi:NAD(P)-dependent dehydrogenase (short-subunit alcohol dehydrogenase family)
MTTTRDRERLDAVAMKTQRTDNSAAPVTGASEGGGKVVARQLTAAGVTVYGNHLGTAGSAPPILLGGFIVVVARRSLRCGVAPVKQIAGIG